MSADAPGSVRCEYLPLHPCRQHPHRILSSNRSITLGTMVLAGVIIVLTLVGSKNLPGLLEVTLFQPFALEAQRRPG